MSWLATAFLIAILVYGMPAIFVISTPTAPTASSDRSGSSLSIMPHWPAVETGKFEADWRLGGQSD
ncbi:MAG: hypothetical protein R2708_17345 [Vicinamibacterales bacterium]